MAGCRHPPPAANWQSDRGAGADNVSVWPLHLELRREANDDRVHLSCEVNTYALQDGDTPAPWRRAQCRSAGQMRGAWRVSGCGGLVARPRRPEEVLEVARRGPYRSRSPAQFSPASVERADNRPWRPQLSVRRPLRSSASFRSTLRDDAAVNSQCRRLLTLRPRLASA